MEYYDQAASNAPSGPTETTGADPRPFLEERRGVIQRFDRSYVTKLLSMTRGNVSEAARKAGVSRQALYGLFKRHEIDPRQFARTTSVS